jgi:2-polyprenyl-3-methyl-5-hydroxy-6-metoxy-1,4-benzoquinol methylase
MANQMDVASIFENQKIHQRWEAVYRHSPIQERLNELLMDRLISALQIKAGDRVLDAGCGTGEHTLRFVRRGFRCVGVDISDYAVTKAILHAKDLGLAGKVDFRCGSLEDRGIYRGPFDAVHCRGVLMHIPAYHEALASLCSTLKVGGRLVLIENNHQSIETRLVRTIRHFRSSASEMIDSKDGLEFRCPDEANWPIWRIANIAALTRQLQGQGVRLVLRTAHEFWDLNRFRSGLPRKAAALWNLCWFKMRLPARLSHGNVLVAEKVPSAAS